MRKENLKDFNEMNPQFMCYRCIGSSSFGNDFVHALPLLTSEYRARPSCTPFRLSADDVVVVVWLVDWHAVSGDPIKAAGGGREVSEGLVVDRRELSERRLYTLCIVCFRLLRS